MSRSAIRGRGVTALLLAVVALGIALLAWGLIGQQSPPTPTSSGRVDPSAPPSAGEGETGGVDPSGRGTRRAPRDDGEEGDDEGPTTQPRAEGPPPLPLSPPRRLRIPALDIDTAVNPIGKNADGTLAVPQPGPKLDQAAWFDQSPSPGQPGPAIIEGHVDSEKGPSVFYDLGDIRPGDDVVISRKDGATVTFTVDAVRDVKKKRFPTELVYGAKDLSTPRLRVITCSQFDPDIGTHVGNTVVFATLTDIDRG